jgi:hypothetical protein
VAEELTAPVAVKVAVPPARRSTLVEISPTPKLAPQEEPAEDEQVQNTPVNSTGNESDTTAPVTSYGPLFVTTIV